MLGYWFCNVGGNASLLQSVLLFVFVDAQTQPLLTVGFYESCTPHHRIVCSTKGFGGFH